MLEVPSGTADLFTWPLGLGISSRSMLVDERVA